MIFQNLVAIGISHFDNKKVNILRIWPESAYHAPFWLFWG